MTDKSEPENRQTESDRRLGRAQLALLGRLMVSPLHGRRDRVSVISSESWVNLLGFVILQVAIAVGWIAATGGHVSGNWKPVLIALAAATLGFGAAHLLARRSGNFQGRELERDYKDLKERSKELSATLDRFEKRPRSSESNASSDAAL